MTRYKLLLTVTVLLQTALATAQVKYWTGANGRWNDPANWSLTQDGLGGAGVPRANEDVVIAAAVPLTITLDQPAWSRSLSVDAEQAAVRITGPRNVDVNIGGSWSLKGDVEWAASGPVNLIVRREGVTVDLRGIAISGDIILNGNGSWSVESALNSIGQIRIQQGTLITNGNTIQADGLRVDGNARKEIIAGHSAFILGTQPTNLLGVLRADASTLVVNGALQDWEPQVQAAGEGDRDINICGTGAGQTPFTVNATLVTDYNGFGVRCRGDCNATVTVSVTGGSGNFTFQWLNGGPPAATWTTACGGPQLVVVTDVGQGISCPAQINVTEPAPVGVIFFGQGTAPTCAGVCDGSRTALAIGGVPPSTYNWNNGAGTSSSFDMLCAGSNTLQIRDANLCTFDTTFVFNLAPISPLLTFEPVSCNGDCDGTATVAPSGGTGAFTVTWSPQPITTSGQFNAIDLCAGDYSVNVSDANGCDTTVTFTIDEPPPLLPNLVKEDATCSNTCDGTAAVTPSGGTGPFLFQWDPPPGGTGQGTGSVDGLCAGSYTVLITDQATSCTVLVPFEIDAPPSIDVQGVVTPASCSDVCDGTIVLTVSGGTAPYGFVWAPQPPTGQGTSTITGLCAGDWQVTVSDAVGCDTTVVFNVSAPPPLSPTLVTTDATCAGECDGTASVDVIGGTSPYTYTWTPPPAGGAGTPDATGLCAGNYTLLIEDDNGCDTTLVFEILEPLPLQAQPSQTDVTCGTLCDGTATVQVSGGTLDYTYLWSPAPINGQGTATVTDLCAGSYSVLITDGNGCTLTQGFTILDAVPIEIDLTLTPASCPNICDGEAEALVTGGLPPYQFVWLPTPPSGDGTPNATGLCPQAYTLTVTDAGGCDTTIAFVIDAPDGIIPNPSNTPATCAGLCDGTITMAPTGGNGAYTYAWSPIPSNGDGNATATGLCAGEWQVTVSSGGCDTTLIITITEPDPIIASILGTDASCAQECDGSATVAASGGTPDLDYLWSPAPGAGQGTPNATLMCPGPYTVTVSDAAGCDTTLSVTILAPPPFISELTITPESCDGPCTGGATLNVSGGTGLITIDWQPPPGAGQGTAFASGLCAGVNYTVTLVDENSCDTTLTFVVPPSITITPNSSSTPVSCSGVCDGTATVGPTGGVAPYTYLWSPPPAFGQGTSSASGLCEGPVQVIITDAEGCVTVASILITGPAPITDNATVTNVLCAGTCTGAISLDTQGGVAPYTYAWTPPPPVGAGSGSISGLCPGPRNVLITDASGCTATFTYIVDGPLPISLIVLKTPSQCQNCIGSAMATVSGGTGQLDLLWQDGDGITVGTGLTVTDLCAGLYTLTVTDENGCTVVETIPVTDSDGESILAIDGVTSCPNTCDGEVSVNYVCGDAPCVVAWSTITGVDLGVSADTLSALCPGNYLVSVTNASGCVTIDTATVVAPLNPLLNISSTGVSCTGDCDGTATAGVAGGTPPFTFLWDPPPQAGQGTPFVSGLCAGVYTVTVGAGGGCETTAEVLITEPAPLAVSNTLLSSVSCFGECDGNITLILTGGTGPFNVVWSPAPMSGQGTTAAFGFCSGPVSAMITDAEGCGLTRNFVIPEPQPLQLNVVAVPPTTCGVCDGTGNITPIGGTGPFEYSWTLLDVIISTDPAPTDLCPGVYLVAVVDASGCTATQVVDLPNLAGEVLTPLNGQTLCSNACEGEVSVSFTCSAPPCTIIWTDAAGSVIAENVETVPGLCNGAYTVQVFNGNNCVSIAEALVLPSQTIVPNLSTTPTSCPGICDGSATVGPMGGVDPYAYTWSPEPGGGQGASMATGLCAGVYEVLIEDASGCDTTIMALILEPTTLVQEAVIIDATCADACTGSIIVTPSGGTVPYTFEWSPVPANGQGSNAAFGSCAGDYILTVTDLNGCSVTNTWTVNEPPALQLVGGSQPSECGLCNGQTFVAVNGGTQPYSYLWTLNGDIYGTMESLSALCPGFYNVLVTDAAGCEAAVVVPVQDLNGELLSTTTTMTSCPGICDGTAEVDFTCSSPACTIAWVNASGVDIGQDTPQAVGLCGGIYFVQVTNAFGCVSIDTAVVAEPDPVLSNLSTTPETCFGACDGTATVGPTGGVAPYEYDWDPEPLIGQGTSQAEGLCAGTLELTIIDSAGCELLVPILILGPPLLTADITVVPITCNGACDGSIVVDPIGGVGPYTFVWTPEPPNGPGSNSAQELCEGDWIVQVIDFNGCDTTYTISLIDPPVLEAQLSTTDNTCFADCIGTAALQINGGVGPYTITWTDGAGATLATDTTDISDLCAGNYTVAVTDSNGCLLTIPFTITEGNAIEAALTFTGETCNGPCDGIAMVDPSGGGGTFDVLWQPIGASTLAVSDLCAGNYSVQLTDQLGCDSTYAFTLLPYTPIDDGELVSDLACNGVCEGSVVTNATGGIGVLMYSWSPEPPNGPGNTEATGLCEGDISLIITDAVGCDSTFTYTITEPLLLELTIDGVTDASCADAMDGAISTTAFGGVPQYAFAWTGPNGFTSTAEDIDSLTPGEYTVTVTDQNGCEFIAPIMVNALVTVVADAGSDAIVCDGTLVVLDGSASIGATTYQWTNDQGEVIGDSAIVELLLSGPGTFTFNLTVSDGVCTASDQVVITYQPLPIGNAGSDQVIFLSEVVTLGGTPSGPIGSTFSWVPDSLVSDPASANPTTSPTTTTWYTLTVVGPNGCVDVDSVLVTVVPTIVIPTGFTPNSDGSNDVWVIDFIELFPEAVVEVYNRWGDQLFRSVGYRQPWDGRYRDGFVPVGTYYYVIELNDARFPEPYTGPLTVIR